jgi:hypothetical protein
VAREREDQDEVRVGHLRDLGREPAGIDDALHGFPGGPDGLVRHRLAKVQVVHDDVHQNPSASNAA